MIILEDGFDLKEEIPTTRFWLMLKLKLHWDKRWLIYLSELKEELISKMRAVNSNLIPTKEKEDMADKMIAKLEKSAWATMPAPFLAGLKIPRTIRR